MTDTIAVQDDLSPAENISIDSTVVSQETAATASPALQIQAAAMALLVGEPEVIAAPAVAAAEEGEACTEAAAPNGFVLLGLAPELVQAVADLGYTQPTAVQARCIPLAMTTTANAKGQHYVDLMVSSQTGSGKTAAFLLPVLHTLIQEQAAAEAQERAEFDAACAEALAKGEPAPKRKKRQDPTNPRNFKAAAPGALIVCPTRELAQQVAHDAIELVKHCRGMRIANVVGGIPYQLQIAKLQNADLVVATPGRLLDLQRSQQIKLDKVKFLVVDEADRMLDLGFSDDLADINDMTLQRQQTMMFSATFAPRIQQLAMRVMHDGGSSVQKIQIDSPSEKHNNIKQSLYWADNAQHKRKLLDHWLRDASINQAIVFASTQIECDGLATDLQQDGFSAVALHGALSQGLRNRRLMALRNGQVQILVATDVAARGIDVPTITHVFNFGLPMKSEDYTHRIGRTGRAGRDGLAITFAEVRDRRKIMDIESYTRQPLKAEVIEGLEPKQRFPDTRMAGGAGRGGQERSYDRNDRGAPRGRPQGNRSFGGGGGFGGGGFGGGGDRFEGRPAPRFEQRSEQPRFDSRKDSRGDVRFEQRPEAGRFDNRSENRFGGAPRQEAGRFEGGRSEARPEGRFEGRGDSRPENRFEPRGDSRPARSGPGEKFARGPKPVGAGSFKPHAPGGQGAPKRNPGAKVLKITRS
jgi:superfamily II DNA/RNA helicase